MGQILPYRTTDKTVTISKEKCNTIRTADVSYTSLCALLASILESHTMDSADAVTGTPLFQSLLSKTADAYKEFDTAKTQMIRGIQVEEGFAIVDWNLDYDTCGLSYTIERIRDRDKSVYEVSENVCHDIQNIQLLHEVASGVISYLVNTHMQDTSDRIVSSAVFQGFTSLKADLMQRFEAAKKSMFQDTVPISEQGRCSNWNLDYTGRTLTCYHN